MASVSAFAAAHDTASPPAGYYDTEGKSPQVKDTFEDETMYVELAKASHGAFSHDQVRLIRRVFDHADVDKNGIVELHELENMLLTIGDSVATRVMKEVLARAPRESVIPGWNFSNFVRFMCEKLTSDEALKILTMEEDYIRSMGITEEEQKDMAEFRKNREVRRSSVSLGGRRNSKPNNRQIQHRPSMPNDVIEYKHEFGLLSDDAEDDD